MSGGVEFRHYRRQMIRAAEELYYGDDVIRKIKNAKTANDITNIMSTARKQQIERGK